MKVKVWYVHAVSAKMVPDIWSRRDVMSVYFPSNFSHLLPSVLLPSP